MALPAEPYDLKGCCKASPFDDQCILGLPTVTGKLRGKVTRQEETDAVAKYRPKGLKKKCVPNFSKLESALETQRAKVKPVHVRPVDVAVQSEAKTKAVQQTFKSQRAARARPGTSNSW